MKLTLIVQINGEEQIIAPKALISELTYSCYCFNRQKSPDITPEKWAKVFGPTSEAMEERYKREENQ